jgi:hypothetical protein
MRKGIASDDVSFLRRDIERRLEWINLRQQGVS